MSPIEIKVALLRKGVTHSSIARSLDVSLQAVSQVIHRKDRIPRIARAVSEAAGKPMEKVFPDYFKPKKRFTTKARPQNNRA